MSHQIKNNHHSNSSTFSTRSSRLSNYYNNHHSSRTSLYNHCGYNIPKSGFNRIKCYCPNVYNHLSANLEIQQPTSEQNSHKMMMMNDDNNNPQSPTAPSSSRTKPRKLPKYQIASNMVKNICKSKSSYWQQKSSVVKLVGTFLIGILFLSLVAVAVLIRVETKTPTATSALNDLNNNIALLASSSTTKTTTESSSKNNNRNNNNRRRQINEPKKKKLALFLDDNNHKQQSSEKIQNNNNNISNNNTNESFRTFKSDSITQGSLKSTPSPPSLSAKSFKLVIDDSNDRDLQEEKTPIVVTRSIFSNEKNKPKRIIIEMDIKVNQSAN